MKETKIIFLHEGDSSVGIDREECEIKFNFKGFGEESIDYFIKEMKALLENMRKVTRIHHMFETD